MEAGRLYVATTTVTRNLLNQRGGGQQDLYRGSRRGQVFGEVFPYSSLRWAPFLEKAFIIEASHLNISTCFCELTAAFFAGVFSVQGRLQPVLDLVFQPSPLPDGPHRRPHPRESQQSEVRMCISMNTAF